jgi:hypothetical protein
MDFVEALTFLMKSATQVTHQRIYLVVDRL